MVAGLFILADLTRPLPAPGPLHLHTHSRDLRMVGIWRSVALLCPQGCQGQSWRQSRWYLHRPWSALSGRLLQLATR